MGIDNSPAHVRHGQTTARRLGPAGVCPSPGAATCPRNASSDRIERAVVRTLQRPGTAALRCYRPHGRDIFVESHQNKISALGLHEKCSRVFTFCHFAAKIEKRLSTTRQIVRQHHCGVHREQFGGPSGRRIHQTVGVQT